jgi:lactate permease
MDALLAALPIVAVLTLMLLAHWPAVRAGAAGLVLALAIALVAFPFEPVDNDIVLGILGALAEAAFTTGAILWIILPALAIYNLQNETSAVDVLRSGLAVLARDPRVTALVVAWFFSLLLEGAAGFGTSAALAAPFLVALGMSPLAAVVAAMIGHLVGVTFGAVGTPVVPMVAASGLEPVELSAAIALQAALVGWSIPIVVVRLIGRAYPDERPQPTRTAWLLGFAAALAFFVPYLLMAVFVGPELPTLAGAILGGGIFVVALRRRRERSDGPGRAASPAPGSGMSLPQAMAPYLILVAIVLVTRLVPPLRDALQGVELSWQADGGTFSGTFAVLYHPGTMLFVALGLGALVQGASGGQVRTALAGSARTIVPVAGALLAMLGLARIMVHAGMVDAIAVAAADSVGGAWPLLAPAVGALGTFVTGSATASNALFSDLQIVTATRVDDPVAVTLGAQGLGAALGNAIAPHNLIAAAAVVGLGGRESEILRRTLPVALPLVAAAGAVALLIANR